MREILLEDQLEFQTEIESEPKTEVLGNISEFTAAKSNQTEPRTYMLI